jgi:hypothetical protein
MLHTGCEFYKEMNYDGESIMAMMGSTNEKSTSASLSRPVLEGKPNANHVRARIRNSRTRRLHK